MLSPATALLLASSTLAAAWSSPYSSGPNGTSPNSTAPTNVTPPFANFTGDPFQKYTLEADGIKASFIPYGARLTNLYVQDSSGNFQDVAIGYDNGTEYLTDTETNRTFFGAVVGRYANRIKNGTFTIDGHTSHIPENEHDGEDTLHGGFIGYDSANWTIASLSNNSITFTFYDAGMSDFPGDVLNIATYTLADGAAFISRLVSIPLNDPTPIMLANHVYWNLGAFVSEEAQLITNSTLFMPYADRFIETDTILVPTGGINLTNGTALDFTSPKPIGQNFSALVNNCGPGCTGIDNGFILDRPRYAQDDPNLEVLQFYSPVTGIKMSLETNQQGLQIYTCNGQNGSIKLKASQQHGSGNSTNLQQYGCLVIETQDWIDGINNWQWGREMYQVFSPTTLPAVNYQRYQFSTV